MISTPVFESRLPVGSSARIEGVLTSARASATLPLPPDALVRFVRHAVAQPRHSGLDRDLAPLAGPRSA
jgi:hypothetical protein